MLEKGKIVNKGGIFLMLRNTRKGARRWGQERYLGVTECICNVLLKKVHNSVYKVTVSYD